MILDPGCEDGYWAYLDSEQDYQSAATCDPENDMCPYGSSSCTDEKRCCLHYCKLTNSCHFNCLCSKVY